MKKEKSISKSLLTYLLIVIIPLFVVNGIFFIFMRSSEEREQKNELQAVMARTTYELEQKIADAVSVSDYLCMNDELNQFLSQKYADEREYYEKFNRFLANNIIRYYYTSQSVYRITIVTDNETITNGTYFIQEEAAKNQTWYQMYQNSGKNVFLCTYYNESAYMRYMKRARNVSVIRRIDIDQGNAILKIDIDYTSMLTSIFYEEQDVDIYLCRGNQIIFTNVLDNIAENFSGKENYEKKELEIRDSIALYGDMWDIYVTADYQGTYSGMKRNLFLSLFVLLFDIGFPVFCLYQTNRVKQERRDLELSKTQAELNALQSQMNPHFMFNTLESIRMHCVLNDEDETEEMLEKFSLLLRQACQWEEDFIPVQEEIHFIRSYLEIQKFRFEDRFEYEIFLDENCKKQLIPKFGILTFVENACIHGVEKRTQTGKVILDVHCEGNKLCILISDNGRGIPAEELEAIQKKIDNASIEDLHGAVHIGMLNAVVRMKLSCKGCVDFKISSEEGKGTKIAIELY